MDQTGSTAEAAANTGEDYFFFTITPVEGYMLNLTSLTLDYDASYNTVNRGFGIRTSVNNFASPVGTVSEAADTGVIGTFVNSSISLSGAAFQGLTSPITIRITVFDSASSVGNSNRFDNVIVNGTVTAIPEPGVVGLIGVACLLSGMTRRRNQG